MIDTYIWALLACVWALLACVVSCYFWVIGNRFKSENLELKEELECKTIITTRKVAEVCFQLSERIDDEIRNLGNTTDKLKLLYVPNNYAQQLRDEIEDRIAAVGEITKGLSFMSNELSNELSRKKPIGETQEREANGQRN